MAKPHKILEFQVALLDDEDFLDPICAAILSGTPADTAWTVALNEQIAEYNSAPDEYLQRARPISRTSATACCERLMGAKAKSKKFPAVPWSVPKIYRRRNFWKSIGRAAAAWLSSAAVRQVTSPCWPAPKAFLWSCNSARYPLPPRPRFWTVRATLELDPTSEQVGLFQKRRELHRKNGLLRERSCGARRRHGR